MHCRDLNGKEIQGRGDVRVRTADSCCSSVETDTALYNNSTPIKNNFKNSY